MTGTYQMQAAGKLGSNFWLANTCTKLKHLYNEFWKFSETIMKAEAMETLNQDETYDKYLSKPRYWIGSYKFWPHV